MNADTSSTNAVTLGLIGLGKMGLGMALNLLRNGFRVHGTDLRQEPRERFEAEGGSWAADAADILRDCPVVFTSLTGPVYLRLAEELMLPACRAGQIFIDTSTVPAPRSREMAARFAACGAHVLDAPVTGGLPGAEAGKLRMFVGGDPDVFARCRPWLAAVCRPEGVTYAGAAGQGQVLKVVQQLKDRLTDAVRLEILAFGLRAGLSPAQIRSGLDISPGQDDPYEHLLRTVEAKKGEQIDVVMAEWDYYLEAARELGIPMPAVEAIHAFCKDGDPVCPDGVGRLAPSVWRELNR